MRDEYNSELYGPLQRDYLQGQAVGTDVWITRTGMCPLVAKYVINILCQDERAVGLSKCTGSISSGKWNHNSPVWWRKHGPGIFFYLHVRSVNSDRH